MHDDTPSGEIEPISAEAARALLYSAIRERLGENWNDEESGWRIVSERQIR